MTSIILSSSSRTLILPFLHQDLHQKYSHSLSWFMDIKAVVLILKKQGISWIFTILTVMAFWSKLSKMTLTIQFKNSVRPLLSKSDCICSTLSIVTRESTLLATLLEVSSPGKLWNISKDTKIWWIFSSVLLLLMLAFVIPLTL